MERSHVHLSIHLLFSNIQHRGGTRSNREVGIFTTCDSRILKPSPEEIIARFFFHKKSSDALHSCGIGKITRIPFDSPTFQRNPGSGKKTLGPGSWVFSEKYFSTQIWTVVGLSPRALPKCDSRHFCGVGNITRREFDSPTFQRHPGSGKKTVGTGSWDFSLSRVVGNGKTKACPSVGLRRSYPVLALALGAPILS